VERESTAKADGPTTSAVTDRQWSAWLQNLRPGVVHRFLTPFQSLLVTLLGVVDWLYRQFEATILLLRGTDHLAVADRFVINDENKRCPR
jgi:hypothetical protein